MDGNYSLSDIAAASGDSAFGGSSSWVLIILFALIFGWGGNGFGGNSAAGATTADIQRAVDLNSIQTGQADISADIQRGIYEINNNTAHNAYDNLGEIRDVQASVATNGANIINALTAMSSNQQNCCCTTQRAIDSVNYNLATQSAAIQANDANNTQKILDAIATNKAEALQQRINQLELQNAVSGVVRYPMASTWAMNGNPFCGCSSSAF